MTDTELQYRFPIDEPIISAEHAEPLLEALLASTIKFGATVFELPDYWLPEMLRITQRISSTKENYSSDVVKNLAPKLFSGLLLPLKSVLRANHVTFASIDLLSNDADHGSTLHTDDVIKSGMSILVPISGPDAKFYHSKSKNKFPCDELDYVVYGVGKAIMLRQSLATATSSGVKNVLPARFHGGWCTNGARKLLSIDFYTSEVISV